jgi:hypothetical protein
MSTVKDCLYGQVRAVEDNVYRGYDVAGKALPTDIPAVLKPYIKKQQVITWDNATGMNPLWDKAPCDDVIYKKYGDMLRDAYEISVHNGLTYVPDLISGGLSIDEYEAKIKEDHNNNYSMLCFALGFWWHIHHLLNQSDALDYDFITVRQMDTWYYPILTEAQVDHVFNGLRRQVLLSPQFDEPKIPFDDIPVAWTGVTMHPIFPMTTWIESYFYMFNRATVEIMREDFFTKILQEIEIFYKRNGPRARPILGKPGTLCHHALIKNDVTAIDISEDIFCWIPPGRVLSVTDFGRNERNVEQVKL